MRLLLLLTLAAVGACATSAPPDRSASTGTAVADSLVADVSVVREPGGGALVIVTFRADAPVSLSATHALRVVTPGGTFEATLASDPAEILQGGQTVTSATYQLHEAGVQALDVAGNRARIATHDGRAYRSHAIRRVDTLE